MVGVIFACRREHSTSELWPEWKTRIHEPRSFWNFRVFLACSSDHAWASQVVLEVKSLPANAWDVEDLGSSLGREDPLEKGMATHSSILARTIPMDRGACGLQSMWPQRVRNNWSNLAGTHRTRPGEQPVFSTCWWSGWLPCCSCRPPGGKWLIPFSPADEILIVSTESQEVRLPFSWIQVSHSPWSSLCLLGETEREI